MSKYHLPLSFSHHVAYLQCDLHAPPNHRPLFGYPNKAIFGETPHNTYLFIRPFVTSQSPHTSSAKFNNEWSYTSAAPLCKHGVDKDNFSFTSYLYIMFILSYVTYIGPGSVVGIATAYGLDGLGIESQWGQIFCTSPDRALRPTQPPVQWVPGLSQG